LAGRFVGGALTGRALVGGALAGRLVGGALTGGALVGGAEVGRRQGRAAAKSVVKGYRS